MIGMPVHSQIDVLIDEDDPANVSLLLYPNPIEIGFGVGGLCLDPIEIRVNDGPFKDALRKLAENPKQCGYGVTWH
jgi:hypothetical protein